MCEACDHPQRAALEQDIRAGMPPSPVAKKYGIRHHAVVLQHERRHMLNLYANHTEVDSALDGKTAGIELTRVDEVSPPSTIEPVHNERSSGVVTYQPNFPEELKPVSLRFWRTSMNEIDVLSEVTALDAIQPALSHVRRAARLIKDQSEYECIVAMINDILQSETMGL